MVWRGRRSAREPTRRRVAVGLTVTGGRFCAPDAAVDEPDCCATEACGHNATTDTVANAAIRNKPNEFNVPPQPLNEFIGTSFDSTTHRGGGAYALACDLTN